MKASTKLLTLGLMITTMVSGAVVTSPATAQAKEKMIHVTETTSTDGTHYFTVDGKYYTPEAYAAWEADVPYNKFGYESAKLAAKKTKSGKSVTVSGKVKVLNSKLAKQHKATYVRIKTYKGYKYAKLSKALTFNKTVKAPKAKTVSAQAGYYSYKKQHGKTVKTFHVWGMNEKAKVKAYK